MGIPASCERCLLRVYRFHVRMTLSEQPKQSFETAQVIEQGGVISKDDEEGRYEAISQRKHSK